MPPVVTMAIGDSNTLGQTGLTGGWRRHLNNLAPNLAMVGRNCVDGTAGYTVGQHEGYGGWYVASHEGGGTLAAIDTYAPSLVLLSLGTNDLYYDGLGSVAATLANILDFAESIAAKASVRWVIVGNIPELHTAEVPYADSLTFRSTFAAAFAGASSEISTCDPAAGMTNPGANFADHYHFSETGYATAAQVWYAAVRARGIQTDLDRSPRRVVDARGYA